MHTQNMLLIADLLERNEPPAPFDSFDMGTYGVPLPQNCGTPACIAGWAAAVAEGDAHVPGQDTHNAAASFFGLTPWKADYLFCAHMPKYTSQITTKAAAHMLRRWSAGHAINWEQAIEDCDNTDG